MIECANPFNYNADGQRTTKPAPSGTTVFHYSMDGLLLAETSDAGNLIRVYFWAEDMPIAQMDTALTYLHADHLDTPRIGTNSSGTIVWQWNSDGFGSLLPNEDPDGNGTATTVNLRFPGQYFDKETGLHYNYFRDYDPKIGRYLESDPIGLMGGLNTFGYVGQNPLRFVDPYGLFELPVLSQDFVDAAAGFGDGFSGGVTNSIRDQMKINGSVNKCSLSYSDSYRKGVFSALGLGIGRLAYAGLAKGYSRLAPSGSAASTFRSQLRIIFGGGGRLRSPNLARYRTDQELRAAAGRTNPYFNAAGAALSAGGTKSFMDLSD